MKKILLLAILLTVLGGLFTHQKLTAYNENFDVNKLEAYLEETKNHMEAFALRNGDLESFEEHSEEFNAYLREMDSFFASDSHSKYIEKQLEANEIRMEALKKMDFDLITKSSEIQNEANDLLYSIGGSGA